MKPRGIGDVVNPKAVSVYQTDAVLILIGGVRGRRPGARHDETVQRTSMFKRMHLALLAGASCLGAGLHQAAAIEAAPIPEPTVIYAEQPAQRPPAMPTAYAGRSNMGGGFIEFLFGDGHSQGERYQQQPPYQPQRSLFPQFEPQQGLRRQEDAGEPEQGAFDPRFEKQLVDYHGREGAGTIVIDTPNKFLFLVQGDGKALRYGIGVGRPGLTWSGIKQISAKKEWPAWTPPPERP